MQFPIKVQFVINVKFRINLQFPINVQFIINVQFVINVQFLISGAASSRWMSNTAETDAEFDARYEAYFNRKDIDGWEIRKGMADLGGMDLVPEPTIVAAALRACRRVNDYALTIRILEVVKFKAQHNPEIWPYMMQELKPTMEELGVSSLEELGYDQPELFIDPQYRN